MIRISLRKMMQRKFHPQLQGIPFNIQQVHEGTGIHRKILSRILNHPEQHTSSDHIEKLVLFFFKDLRQPEMTEEEERTLLKNVTTELIEIYPDEDEYWQGTEDLKNSPDRFSIPISILWQIGRTTRAGRQKNETNQHRFVEGQQRLLNALFKPSSKETKSS